MNQKKIQIGEDHAKSITLQLRERLSEYAGLDISGGLKLTKQIDRRFCKLFLYQTSPTSMSTDLVVKVPIGRGDLEFREKVRQPEFQDRPRLFGRADPTKKPLHEFEALRRIEAYFGQLDDSRFDVVRVFDFFPQQNALVMGWNPHPSFRQHLYKSNRFGSSLGARNLECVLEHLGAWLRQHHELPRLPHCETRNSLREDYISAVERFIKYLSDNTADAPGFAQIEKKLMRLVEVHLPPEIETGQVHGDFAPRNAFTTPTNAVTVFDTLGRFEAPVFEDIAKMLMTVKASGPQLASFGVLFDQARLQRFERHFLEGYFANRSIPFPVIRLFEAQLVLEHWAAMVYRHRHGRGLRGWAKGLRRFVWKSGFQAYINHLVADCFHADGFRKEVTG